jgi:membrane protein implicated in regulation of membrane protease activity
MKRTNDDIEEPVKKSPWLLSRGILLLALLLFLGVYLLVEALKTPDGPQDVLDMKRMLASGVSVILFSFAVLFFLIRLYKPKASKKKPTRKKAANRSRSTKK